MVILLKTRLLDFIYESNYFFWLVCCVAIMLHLDVFYMINFGWKELT